MPDTVDLAVLGELKATTGSDFVGELLQTFFEEAPQMIAELRAAQRAGSVDRFRRAAHSLKTNADTFGAAALGASARELEHGGVPADEHGIDVLQSQYDTAVAALRALVDG